jgi:hypothetical protein
VTALVVDGRWPPDAPHLIVHVAAGAFALLLAYAAVTTVMLIEGVRGLAGGVSRLDDMARAGAEVGLNVLDAMVDSVDGPNRYGFRGLRDPASVPVPSIAQVAPIVAGSLPPIPPAPRRDPLSEHHPTWPAMTPVPSESWR